MSGLSPLDVTLMIITVFSVIALAAVAVISGVLTASNSVYSKLTARNYIIIVAAWVGAALPLVVCFVWSLANYNHFQYTFGKHGANGWFWGTGVAGALVLLISLWIMTDRLYNDSKKRDRAA